MGKLLVIDGLDGSGKTTQCELIAKDLQSQGYNVKLIHFPNYESDASILVRQYLGGEFGSSPDAVSAYAASSFYAVERFSSYKKEWEEFYKKDDSIVLACRYTTANCVHQLAKLDRELWNDFLEWIYDFEYEKIGIPRPDLVLFLEMKPEISAKLIKHRNEKTGQAIDIHETDIDYKNRCYKAAMYAIDKLDWKKICCYDEDDEVLSISDIEDKILVEIQSYLTQNV